MKYAFVKAHSADWPVRWLCRQLDIHPSGYYAWRRQPKSRRTKANEHITGLIKQFWLESGGVYGYRKIHADLREVGEQVGVNRVHRLMRLAGLRAQVGYRKPTSTVTVHSDQGSQYTSHDWQAFLKQHNLEGSMSRRGNCHDNAVAESFFQLLKRERIKRHIYPTREAARADVFNYIEMFYNSKRRHSFNNLLSPVEYEKRFTKRLAGV